jgi:predicted ATPase
LALPLVGEHANGVWWVDLAAVTGVENIALAIANAANLQLAEGDALSSLLRALGPRETWLILDNCERCAGEAAHVVAQSLAAAPRLRILVTTQAALQVQDEQIYRLDVLAVPPHDATLEDARACGAVQLFEHRARAADHRFSLDATNVGAVVRLCRRLDGIALAIEMAAARLPLLGLDGLDAILGDRLRLLKNHRRAVPARQQTLRATLDWSHLLLDEAEQVALRRLSVFAGSFRLDVAQQVAASESLDEWAVLDALAGLVDKSLVQLVPHEPPRYRLLETTRLYAREHLMEHAEVDAVEVRHGCAMAMLANEVEEAYWTTPDAAWLARYLPEYEDLRAAFHRACHQQDAETGAATLDALLRLDHLRAIILPMRIHIQSAFSLAQTQSPLARARLELRYAAPFIALATHLPKLTLAHRAVATFRELGDQRRLYEGLLFAAENSPVAGEVEQAEPLLRAAQALVESRWPPRLRWLGAFHATRVYGRLGNAGAHRSSIRSELEFAEQAGSPCQAASARVNLVDAALMAGNYDEAVALGSASVDELRTLNLPHMLSISLLNLCAALIRRRDLSSARQVAVEALPASWQNDLLGTMLCHLALLAASLSRTDLAVPLLGFADAWFRRNQSTPEVNEARSIQLTYDIVHAAITPAEVAALARDGEHLSSAQAYDIAAEWLAGSGLADGRSASAA